LFPVFPLSSLTALSEIDRVVDDNELECSSNALDEILLFDRSHEFLLCVPAPADE